MMKDQDPSPKFQESKLKFKEKYEGVFLWFLRLLTVIIFMFPANGSSGLRLKRSL
jgi:hypothetical protein